MGRAFRVICTLAFLCLAACADEGFRSNLQSSQQNSASLAPDPSVPADALKICSRLSFDGASIPATLNRSEYTSFQLALNISGAYEGSGGWANISNNFDGTGLSLGLLNQTLGTGSLQPILVKMRKRYPTALRQVFSANHLADFLDMLSQWEKGPKLLSLQPFSLLDLPEPGDVAQLSGSRESASVAWALKNLYSDKGKTFVPSWRSELTTLARTPEYISLQIEEAIGIHDRTMDYFERLGIYELRSYLFAFDIIVQNGSFSSKDWNDYVGFVVNNPKATSTEKLLRMLSSRLKRVRPEYIRDVRSRKEAIIYGKGIVHGESINLERRYCYDGETIAPQAQIPGPDLASTSAIF